jgi:hypothetical protein
MAMEVSNETFGGYGLVVVVWTIYMRGDGDNQITLNSLILNCGVLIHATDTGQAHLRQILT